MSWEDERNSSRLACAIPNPTTLRFARDSSGRGNGNEQGGDENDGPSTSHRRQFTGVRCLSLDARHCEGREEGAYPISIVPNSGSKVGSRYLRGMPAHCQVPPSKKVAFVLSRWDIWTPPVSSRPRSGSTINNHGCSNKPNRAPPLEAPSGQSPLVEQSRIYRRHARGRCNFSTLEIYAAMARRQSTKGRSPQRVS